MERTTARIAAHLLRCDRADSVQKFDRSGLLGEDTGGGGGDGARESSILGSKGRIRGWHLQLSFREI
jgi:hypothetical protein